MKKPSYNEGDYCRITKDSKGLECQISSLKDDQKLVIKILGSGEELTIESKDVLPSLGKSERTKQIMAGSNGLKWKVGDKCLARRENSLIEAKIFEIVSDGGNDYAIITFQDNMSEDSAWLNELELQLSKAPEVTDLCRAMWEEDHVIYESKIKSIDSAEGRKYCIIEFLYYGNEASVWIEELLESHGDASRKKQMAEAGVTEEASTEQSAAAVNGEAPTATSGSAKAWKEKDPCRALLNEDNVEYEGTIKAIKEDGSIVVHFIGIGKDELKNKNELKVSLGKDARTKQRAEGRQTPATKEWKAGMFCRAVFTEDGLEYEALIKSVETSDGNTYAYIQYLGYGNAESAWLTDLMDSRGEEARDKQIEESKLDYVAEQPIDAVDGPIKDSAPVVKEMTEKELREVSKNAMTPTGFGKYKVGYECRAVFETDGLEYEGKIEELSNGEDGSQYAVVRFYGYGDIQSVWLTEILESKGQAARDEQIKAALADVNNNPTEPAQDQIDGQKNTAQETPKVTQQEKKTEAEIPKKIAEFQWKLEDFCRGTCKFDGQEHELQIVEVHPTKDHLVRVKVLGCDKLEIINKNDLEESQGEAARKAQIDANTKQTPKETTPKEVVPETKVPVEKKESPVVSKPVMEEPKPGSVPEKVPQPKLNPEPLSQPSPIAQVPITPIGSNGDVNDNTLVQKMLNQLNLAQENQELQRKLEQSKEENSNLKKMMAVKDTLIIEMRHRNEKDKQAEEKYQEILTYVKELKNNYKQVNGTN